MLKVSEWTGPAKEWDEFVLASPGGTVFHLFAWKAVVEEAYGHRTYYLAAHDETGLRGVLPLVLTRSPFFGTNLVSMPYVDYGGIAADDEEVKAALLTRSCEIRLAHGATLVLRYLGEPRLGLPVSLEKVTMLLELGESVERLWARLPSERRNRIRKGQKNGLVASFHREDGLAEFFEVYATNMRDLGSPVHAVGFFRAMLRYLGEHASVLLVRDGGRAIGGAVCLFFNNVISIPWVSSLRRFFHRCPNQVLYWEAMRYGIANGYRVLDFGRSTRGSGTFEAKRQWGANEVQLHWVYWPEAATPPGVGKGRFSWASELWQYLPLFVANTIGPWLRRGIPN